MARSDSPAFGSTTPGDRTDFTLRGALPTPLRYSATVARVDEPDELLLDVSGDLNGTCRVAVVGHEDGCDVLTFWDVSTARRWPHVFGRLLAWLFAWNHHRALADGERGLTALLATDGPLQPAAPLGVETATAPARGLAWAGRVERATPASRAA